jgi:LemA protein
MGIEWVIAAPFLGAGAAIAYGVIHYNRIVALNQRCETAMADIDVQIKHRHSVLPGLVETVRGFAGHESSILDKITKARGLAMSARTPQASWQAESELSRQIATVMTVAENYPEIAASAHFRDLRMEISDVENKISAARRFYNLAVQEYNTALGQFPGALIADQFNMGPRTAYDLGIERVLLDEPVAIKF